MADTINFLRVRRKKLTKTQAQDKKILRVVMIIFGIIVVSASLSSGVFFFFSQRRAALQFAEEQLRSRIVSQESAEKTYVILASKLTALRELLQLRQDRQAAISFFYDRLGPDIILQEIEYDRKTAATPVLNLAIRAPEIFSFEQVKTIATSDEVNQTYPGISSSDITRNADGTYLIRLAVPLGLQQPPSPSDPATLEVPSL